jgi:phosphatidyl-myo-inositol dimannoside synthase
MPSLLVTNDFPPKHGGIQSYLYELWRRLPPDETTVLTTAFPASTAWDREQAFRIERVDGKVLWPTSALRRRIDSLAREVRADVIFVDPMLPLGMVAPHLTSAPYVVVAHGAEITGYGRVPLSRPLARRVLRGAAGIVAAGSYPAREARRLARAALPERIVPPGVDVDRFRPYDDEARKLTRARFGLDPERPLVLGLSRLVPRKGFDVVIDACAALPDVQVAIAGAGRDRKRLERRAKRRVRFLGRIDDGDLPALHGAADVFAMCCRERWAGLEAEGFGIVFLEAAACAVPSVAGRSGGSHEAVVHGETGFVVDPKETDAVREAIRSIVTDDALRRRMGESARARAVAEFSYDRLAAALAPVAAGDFTALGAVAE